MKDIVKILASLEEAIPQMKKLAAKMAPEKEDEMEGGELLGDDEPEMPDEELEMLLMAGEADEMPMPPKRKKKMANNDDEY